MPVALMAETKPDLPVSPPGVLSAVGVRCIPRSDCLGGIFTATAWAHLS